MTAPARTNDAPDWPRKLDWAGDDAVLRKLVRQGVNTDAICERLGRPRSSVFWRKSVLGLCDGPLKRRLETARAEIASLKSQIEEARADERARCEEIADSMVRKNTRQDASSFNDGARASAEYIRDMIGAGILEDVIRARKDDAHGSKKGSWECPKCRTINICQPDRGRCKNASCRVREPRRQP